MTPNSKPKYIIAILTITLALTILFVLNFFFGKPASLLGYGQIPEMRKIARMDASWYDIEVIRYDGTTMTWIDHRIWYENEVYLYNKCAHNTKSLKPKAN